MARVRIRRRRSTGLGGLRRPFRRLRRRRPRGSRSLGLALLALGLLAFAWIVGSRIAGQIGRQHPRGLSTQIGQDAVEIGGAPVFESDFTPPQRLVYRYSVIPGGITGPGELKAAMDSDPVVASHYADFDLSASRVIRLKTERLAYVSYRLHNEIFWTQTQLRLPAGERLITDGVHFARTRCGNRIAAFSQVRVSPLEPPLITLEAPEISPPPELAGNVLPFEREQSPGSALPATIARSPVGEIGPIPVIPGGFIAPPSCAPPFVPGTSTAKPCRTPPCVPKKGSPCVPVSRTPEPGTLLLVFSGAAYLVYRLKPGKPNRLSA